MSLSAWWCRLFGYAAVLTYPEPWRVGTAHAWRSVVSVCPRCDAVVRRWLEASEEVP